MTDPASPAPPAHSAPPPPHAPPLRNLRLTLEYDGTAYFGWQAQAGGGTVQQKLVAAIAAVTSEVAVVYAAGRTDAGVHARGQVANFHTRCRVPVERIPHALNAHLPRDIAVLACVEAPPDFHAQFDAAGKHYRYRILHRDVPSALEWRRTWWVRTPLDLAAMRAAGRLLVGRHDFRAFATQSAQRKNTVREIASLDITREGDYIFLDVVGTGFLHNMVRTISGTLVLVGKGALPPAGVADILASCDRKRAGPVAPPQGLYMMRVFYPGDPGAPVKPPRRPAAAQAAPAAPSAPVAGPESPPSPPPAPRTPPPSPAAPGDDSHSEDDEE
ncbi:MAG: tRNA pseudouridine(38-40) synthase TruA [Planctomycetes bacterium]|nr:tRNA pseudouridine(38-40) synthase TruA [Planctomycetota bacterium]